MLFTLNVWENLVTNYLDLWYWYCIASYAVWQLIFVVIVISAYYHNRDIWSDIIIWCDIMLVQKHVHFLTLWPLGSELDLFPLWLRGVVMGVVLPRTPCPWNLVFEVDRYVREYSGTFHNGPSHEQKTTELMFNQPPTSEHFLILDSGQAVCSHLTNSVQQCLL